MEKIQSNIDKFKNYLLNSPFKEEVTSIGQELTVANVQLVRSMFDVRNIDKLVELAMMFVIKKDASMLDKYTKDDVTELKKQIGLIFDY